MEKSLSDHLLLASIAERQAGALELLYDRYARALYVRILRIVREPAAAEDILQETFCQVWEKAAHYRSEGAPAAWLHRIARNKSLDYLRRQKAQPRLMERGSTGEEGDALQPRMATDGDITQESAERAILAREVRRALDRLPPSQRVCLELAYFENMSRCQIAEMTAVPVGTIKSRIRLGLRTVSRLMSVAGYLFMALW